MTRLSALTEEERKKLLKSLLAEKDQESSSNEEAPSFSRKKKFLQKLSLWGGEEKEDNDVLKNLLNNKDDEIFSLKSQLGKIKPILQKLAEDLKNSRMDYATILQSVAQLEPLQEKINHLEEEKKSFLQQIESLQLSSKQRESELQRTIAEYQQIKEQAPSISFEEHQKIQTEKSFALQELEKEKKETETLLQKTKLLLKEKEEELIQKKENDQQEQGRFEAERQRLVEKLAETLTQVQKQHHIIQDLREESALLKREAEIRDEQDRQSEKERLLQAGSLPYAPTFQEDLEKQWNEEKKRVDVLRHELIQLKEALLKEKFLSADISQQLREKESEKLRATDQLAQALMEMERHSPALLKAEFEKQIGLYQQETERNLSSLQQAILALTVEKESLLQQLSEAKEEIDITHAKTQEEILSKVYVKFKEFTQRNAELTGQNHLLQTELSSQKQLFLQQENEVETLRLSYRNAKTHTEEKEAEIRRAQQHLAKKIKENTILRDIVERQKIQIGEWQKSLMQQKTEMDRLYAQLALNRSQEEKMHSMMKEKNSSLEKSAKEWQEKLAALDKKYHQALGQLEELNKIKVQYEQMSATVSSLRHLLGNTEGDLPVKQEKKKNSPSFDDFFE